MVFMAIVKYPNSLVPRCGKGSGDVGTVSWMCKCAALTTIIILCKKILCKLNGVQTLELHSDWLALSWPACTLLCNQMKCHMKSWNCNPIGLCDYKSAELVTTKRALKCYQTLFSFRGWVWYPKGYRSGALHMSFLNLYNYSTYVYNLRRVKYFLWTVTINLITLSFVHASKGNIVRTDSSSIHTQNTCKFWMVVYPSKLGLCLLETTTLALYIAGFCEGWFHNYWFTTNF